MTTMLHVLWILLHSPIVECLALLGILIIIPVALAIIIDRSKS